MNAAPMKESVQLVAQVTGKDLSGLTRDEFIVKVEELAKEQEELETKPRANEQGQVKLTMSNVGLGSVILRGVLNAEKKMRLN